MVKFACWSVSPSCKQNGKSDIRKIVKTWHNHGEDNKNEDFIFSDGRRFWFPTKNMDGVGIYYDLLDFIISPNSQFMALLDLTHEQLVHGY